jgi:hypothetical protein
LHRHTITHKSTHSQPHINLLEVLQDVLLGNRQKKAQTNGLCTTKGGLASVNKSTSFFYLLRHLLNKFQLFAKIVLRTSHKHTHALTCLHTHTRTHTHTHKQTSINYLQRSSYAPATNTHMHSHAQTHRYTHKYQLFANIVLRTSHKHTHALTRAHTHTHTHTHTQTHRYKRILTHT